MVGQHQDEMRLAELKDALDLAAPRYVCRPRGSSLEDLQEDFPTLGGLLFVHGACVLQ